VGPVFGSGEHDLAVVGRRQVSACRDNYNSQLKRRGDTVARDGKRTNIDLVALERVPVDFFLVEFDQRPVTGERMGSVADDDGFGVEDETNGALLRGRPEPGDVVVKLAYLLDPLLRPLHQVLVLLALVGRPVILLLTLGGLGQPGNTVVPDVDRTSEVADLTEHVCDSLAIALDPKCDDFLGRLASVLVRHAHVGERGRRTGNVGGGKEDSALVGVADVEV
jgi:hypothetical protein